MKLPKVHLRDLFWLVLVCALGLPPLAGCSFAITSDKPPKKLRQLDGAPSAAGEQPAEESADK